MRVLLKLFSLLQSKLLRDYIKIIVFPVYFPALINNLMSMLNNINFLILYTFYKLFYHFTKYLLTLLIATKPCPHKNGSHKGIVLNNEFLMNVSTPVDIKIHSNMIIKINPPTNTAHSLFVYFTLKSIKMIII